MTNFHWHCEYIAGETTGHRGMWQPKSILPPLLLLTNVMYNTPLQQQMDSFVQGMEDMVYIYLCHAS
jgi:hypothetical protein